MHCLLQTLKKCNTSGNTWLLTNSYATPFGILQNTCQYFAKYYITLRYDIIPLFIKYCNTFCFWQYLLQYFVIFCRIFTQLLKDMILFVFSFVLMQNIYKGYSTACKVLQYLLFLAIIIAILCHIMQNISQGIPLFVKYCNTFCFWQYLLKCL